MEVEQCAVHEVSCFQTYISFVISNLDIVLSLNEQYTSLKEGKKTKERYGTL